MKDNKPLLFINSAQSGQLKDQNQYVYDSRFDNNDPKIIKEIKKDTRPRIEDVKKKFKDEVKKENTRNVILGERETNIKSVQPDSRENETKKKKLINKMELLNKRAKLGRFVLVSIEKSDHKLEGFFTKLLENSIILSVKEEEQEILIQDIEDIIILKV